MFCQQRHSERYGSCFVTTAGTVRQKKASGKSTTCERIQPACIHPSTKSRTLLRATSQARPCFRQIASTSSPFRETTDQTSRRARGRRRSTVKVCWRPQVWPQANQGAGQGGHAEPGEALERLRTRTHLVGDPTAFDATSRSSRGFPSPSGLNFCQ